MEALRNPNGANSCPLTPLGFLERAATVFADSPSLIYNNLSYTWAHTFRRCLQLASSISRLGIGKSDVVSVIAPNIPATYELHFAVTMTGAVINTINTHLDAHIISTILHHSESKLLFVDYEYTHHIHEALSRLPDGCYHPQLVLITDDGPLSSPTNHFINTYQDMVETGDPDFNWVRPQTDWDPLTLNYKSGGTWSGTTSSPKGVVHSHRGTFIVAMDSLLEWNVPKQPVYLWTLPMFHSSGWSYVWGMAAVGATNICLRTLNASAIYTSIRRHNVTHMCGAPVILDILLSEGEKLDHRVQIITSRAPLRAAVLRRTESLGFDVSHGYGLTEMGGMVLMFMWKREWNGLSAMERALLKARQGVRTIGMTAVDIVNAKSGVSIRRNGLAQGEIVLRGGCLMLCYLKDHESSAKCIRNGWLYTGDMGVMHPDGYLVIKDRSTGVIMSGGENFISFEVESVLCMHPAVNEVVVVGRPDEFWGETSCAFVSLKVDEGKPLPTAEEIMGFCKGKMAGFMVPKSVVFKEELPKTSTGKILKSGLLSELL